MRIVYLGSGQFGIECLNALAKSNHSLAFIVTQPPQPAGRGRKTRPTPVARWADANSMPYMESDSVNAPSDVEVIAENQPDLIVVVAFGQKIGDELINLPSKGAINVHASLLPKYRGAAPINWAIINGERQTGISIIALVEKMDAGDILAQQECEIGPDETAGQLHDSLAQMAAPLLLRTIDKIEDGSVVYTQQVIIAEAKVVQSPNPTGLAAGTLDEDLNIICGRDALKITRIKPAGSSLMDFRDFVNGRQTQPGDTFVKIKK